MSGWLRDGELEKLVSVLWGFTSRGVIRIPKPGRMRQWGGGGSDRG